MGKVDRGITALTRGAKRYSLAALARQALGGHTGWPRAWRDAARASAIK